MDYTDGFFQLIIKSDGTYLRLFPPNDNGKKIQIKELAQYLEEQNIKAFDIKILNNIIQSLSKIVEIKLDSEQRTLIREKMYLFISDDRMQVEARLYPPSSKEGLITKSDIISLLKLRGIKYGILVKQLEQMFRKREYCKNIIIAQGKSPRDGHHARIEYYFNTDKKARPRQNTDGSVDFHQLDLINHIEKGQKLATLIPEDKGDNGYDVFGNIILPKKMKTASLSYGNNIKLSEDRLEIFSEIDGNVTLEGGKVFVSNTYEVLADVDSSTGDIEYDGNVSVKGNVRTGFTVRATGDIQVDGVVEGANLYAGGQVILKRGIQGMNKGYIESQGNVVAKFIENSTIRSGASILTEAIMHSEVSSVLDIVVSGKKGLITGGQVKAGSLVEAKVFGSNMETVTKVEVGVNPDTLEEFKRVSSRLNKIPSEIETNKKTVDLIKKKILAGEELPKTKKILLKESIDKLKVLEQEKEELELKLSELDGEILDSDGGQVKVSNVMYPGVQVYISDCTMFVKKELKYCRLVKNGADVKVVPY